MGYDDEQEGAGTFGDENRMPDGEYTIKLRDILYKEIVKKPGDVAIELTGAVTEGANAGESIANSWYLTPTRSNAMTLKDFNTFIQAAKIEVKVSQLRDAAICGLFAGITLKAKKETRESKGKSYVSWKYWSFVAASDGADSADHGPDIDLDEDPFKATE